MDGFASVREARRAWRVAQNIYRENERFVLKRLIYEAAYRCIGLEEVAKASGLTVKRVRALMREFDLNPRMGRGLLSEAAAKALRSNADLMGVEPQHVDLTSPLAYLPMGEQMKEQLIAARISRVDDLPATVHGVDLWSNKVACGGGGYGDPVLVVSDASKITCSICRERLWAQA